MKRIPTDEELAEALAQNLKDLEDIPKTQLRFFINLCEIYAQMYRWQLANAESWDDVKQKQGIVSGFVMLRDTIRGALEAKEAESG